MRHSDTLTVGKYTITVYELTVGQVLSLLKLMSDYEYPTQLPEFITAHKDNLLIRAVEFVQITLANKPVPISTYFRFPTDDRARINQLFLTVNVAFFGKPDNAQTTDYKPPAITASSFYPALAKNVELITRNGHANVLAYPFSYYLTVLDNINHG